MANSAVSYTPLPGRHRKFFSPTGDGASQRAWLGSDHILVLQHGPMTEQHRRLYFRDIQAITIHATSTSRYVSIATGGLSIIFLGASVMYVINNLLTSFSPILVALLGTISLILGCASILNVLLGPSCVCMIHTAVQREELFGLYRLRAAHRFIARVSPPIEEVQGALSLEEIESKAASLRSVVASQYASPKSNRDQDTRHEPGTLHMATFVLLIIGSISAFIDIVYMSDAKNAVDAAIFSVLVVINILAIIRQNNSDMPKEVCAITWGSMIFIGLNFTFMAGLLSFAAAIQSVQLQPADLMDFVMDANSTLFTGYLVIIAMIQVVLGVAGLILLQHFRDAYRESVEIRSATAEPEESAS